MQQHTGIFRARDEAIMIISSGRHRYRWGLPVSLPVFHVNRFSHAVETLMRLTARSIPALSGGFLVAAAAANCPQANESATLRYEITYLGITIGSVEWHIDLTDDQYSIAVSGEVNGMMSVLINGRGSGTTRSVVSNGRASAANFEAHVVTSAEDDTISMSIQSGAVRTLLATPPFPPTPKRVPLTADTLRNVIDPLSATFVLAGSTEIASDACMPRLPVFDGRRRYDVDLSFKRTEKIEINPDYRGIATVCSARLVPIAGHRLD